MMMFYVWRRTDARCTGLYPAPIEFTPNAMDYRASGVSTPARCQAHARGSTKVVRAHSKNFHRHGVSVGVSSAA